MDQHLLFGLALCALLVVFFFTRGRKNDTVSWLALLIGIVAILVICTHWSAIAQWWPATPAAHAAPISIPAPLHAVAPVSPAANEAVVHLATALGSGVVIVFLVVVAVLVVILAFVRRNQPRRSPIHPATRSTRSASSANRAKSSAR